jgi:hypothetical protein
MFLSILEVHGQLRENKTILFQSSSLIHNVYMHYETNFNILMHHLATQSRNFGLVPNLTDKDNHSGFPTL